MPTSSTRLSATCAATRAERRRLRAELARPSSRIEPHGVAARRAPGRGQAEQHAGPARHDRGEEQGRAIEAERQVRDLDPARQLEPRDQLHRHGGDVEPGAAAEQSQDQAFDQQLPRDPTAAGADRHPHRDLAPPSGAARQLQIREIRAADQQRDRDDRPQQLDERIDAAGRAAERAQLQRRQLHRVVVRRSVRRMVAASRRRRSPPPRRRWPPPRAAAR